MRSALLLAFGFSLLAAGCTRAQDDPAFGAKVRAYLLAHPEVLQEAVEKLNERRQTEADVKSTAALKDHRAEVERDPRDFVANPAGRITLTEFYDYRCPHCINAVPAVLDIIRQNPDVRVVFKEMPIFGASSERAAQAALGVKHAGGDYLGVWRDLMTAKPLNDDAIARVLRQHGVDAKAVTANRTAAVTQLQDVQKLAMALGVEGTPAFIVGDTIVPGEDMEAVRAAIAAERKKKG